jgi:hypothetical protein
MTKIGGRKLKQEDRERDSWGDTILGRTVKVPAPNVFAYDEFRNQI